LLLSLALAACSDSATSPALVAVSAPLDLQSDARAASPAKETGRGFVVDAAPIARRRAKGASLRVELGADARAPFRVVVSPGGAIGVRRGASWPAPGHLENGEVVYEGIASGVDARVFATRGGVEELLIVRAPQATLGYALDLPRGWTLARSAVPGLVEARDERRAARVRLWMRRAWDASGRDVPIAPEVEGARVRVRLDASQVTEWPVVVDPEWTDAGELTIPRYGHTATLLPDGRVLIAGGDTARLGLTEIFDPRTATFTSATPMSRPRAHHTATRTLDGRVLLAGGGDTSDALLRAHDPSASVDVFDPVADAITPAGNMNGPRSNHTATILPDGHVVFVGGLDGNGTPRADAETFDPTVGASSGTSIALAEGRADHAAALLPDGRVLVTGGLNTATAAEVLSPSSGTTAAAAGGAPGRWLPSATLLPSARVLVAGDGAAEIFDPATSSLTASSGVSGAGATATLLPSGRVLLAGGNDGNYGSSTTLSSAAVFDPMDGRAISAEPMEAPRERATATLLPSGLVLVAGGWSSSAGTATATAEIYDPGATIESTGAMLATRMRHTSTLLASGLVLVAGGQSSLGAVGAELFDPVTAAFRAAGPVLQPRMLHSATALGDGTVLIAGGTETTSGGALLASTELFDPGSERFLPGSSMIASRTSHAALGLPDGSVLIAGYSPEVELRSPGGSFSLVGMLGWAGERIAGAPLPMGRALVAGGRDIAQADAPVALATLYDGGLAAQALMKEARSEHTATALPDGSVLVAGGSQGPVQASSPTASTERFVGSGFVSSASMVKPRALHTATLLSGGASVLVAGGIADGSAELYDVATGAFSLLASVAPEGVNAHAATLLADGRVLLTGGLKSDGISSTAVLFDPTTQAFSYATTDARAAHTATLLPSGELLVAGGSLAGQSAATPTASLFDPETRAFTPVAPMATQRLGHTATLTGDGRVVISGGWPDANVPLPPTPSVEAWNGAAFVGAGQLVAGRVFHSATPLAKGGILIAGGRDASEALASAEIYDPATGASRSTAGSMLHARSGHAGVRLSSGRVLLVGGHDASGVPVPAAEIYDAAADVFTEVTSGAAPIPGDAHAAVLASGEVMIVGDLVTYRFDEAANELTVAGTAPTRAFGLASLAGGRAVACGLDACDVGVGSAFVGAPVLDGSQKDGHTLTALADGEIFALGTTPIGARHTFSLRSHPADAVRPVLASTAVPLVAGQVATLQGMRLARPSARGGEALPPLPTAMPLVVLAPDGDVAPILAETRSWSDDSITFVAPRTPYWGGGFLRALVDGVPSAGVRVQLLPALQGTACGLDGECASGHCSEGVCCDRACDSGCSTCRATASGGADGVCTPIAEGGPPRSGCEPTGDACSPTGRCDGLGECDFPPEGTACTDPPGGTCVKGACVGKCTSTLDCVAGFVCVPDGRCVAPVSPGPDAPSCAVARPAAPPGDRLAAGAALLGALLAVRLRRATRTSGTRTPRRRQKP
jgi:hypothetical protein